uniref:Protein kinase domain-containing protein n=1 Tax=Rhizophagus irregularis (strain DAOM 181602 / DAOM 197198 / MUCL 43194) TaxID=747089 RepID=U9TCH5_RHIID
METCKNCRVIGWCEYCKVQSNKYSPSICGYCKTIKLLLCNECENPNWSNWSSGNKIVDDFIKECNKPNEVLKWIPYNQFSEITYLAKGGFGEIYKAKWKGAYVVLKKLYDSQNITVDFLNEVKNYIQTMESNRKNCDTSFLTRFYGISDNDYYKFSTNKRIIFDIAQGLKIIHSSGLVHCDLHIGNILLRNQHQMPICISDFGLSQPANISSSIKSSGIYGVIPYVAPEIFLGKPYTQASDIYSLGIIIWVLYSLEEPYNNRCHDANLILEIIVRGLRPEIPPQLSIPNYIKELMEKCWDSDPTNRPTAEQIITMLKEGPNQPFLENSHRKKVCLLKIMNLIGNHPGTCYTSRFLSFQSVKEHLSRSTLEDSGKSNLSLPTSINNDDFIRDFGDEIIALPTLPNTSVTSLPQNS